MAAPFISSMEGGLGSHGLIPSSLGIMLVDEDPTSLLFLHTMLKTCHYRDGSENFLSEIFFESFNSAVEALYALWERRGEFDLVITEIYMDSMHGFKLLERIVTGIDIPVITMCADDDPKLLTKALTNGACFHLVKPITITNIDVVWRKAWKNKSKGTILPERVRITTNPDKGEGISDQRRIEQIDGSSSENAATDGYNSKRKKNDDKGEGEESNSEELKQPRLQWDFELHQRFLIAVRLLGDHAIPKNIVSLMNVEGLTTKQVASHLQKHRKRVEKAKQSSEDEQISLVPVVPPRPRFPTSLAPNLNQRLEETIQETNQMADEPKLTVQHNKENQGQIGASGGRMTNRKPPFILPKPSATYQVNTPNSIMGLNAYSERASWGVSQLPMVANHIYGGTQFPNYGINPIECNLGSSVDNSSIPLACNPDPSPINNQFQYIMDSSIGSNQLQYCNVDTAGKNNSIQEPAADPNDDWAGLDAFLGINEPESAEEKKTAGVGLSDINEPQCAEKEKTAEIGSLSEFELDCDFDLENFDFDEAFLAELLDDT